MQNARTTIHKINTKRSSAINDVLYLQSLNYKNIRGLHTLQNYDEICAH